MLEFKILKMIEKKFFKTFRLEISKMFLLAFCIFVTYQFTQALIGLICK